MAFTILKQLVIIIGFIFNFAILLLLFVITKFTVFLVNTLTSPKSISALSNTKTFSTDVVCTSMNATFKFSVLLLLFSF